MAKQGIDGEICGLKIKNLCIKSDVDGPSMVVIKLIDISYCIFVFLLCRYSALQEV